jgi:hypothetical protein
MKLVKCSITKNIQRFIILAGIIAIIFIFLFPPFHIIDKGRLINVGYAFITEPPAKGNHIAEVNYQLLLVQTVGVMIVVSLAVWMTSGKE